MTGSNPFSIEKIDYFEISFRKLAKATAKGLQQSLIDKILQIIEVIENDPRPSNSRQEPCPKKIFIPPLCEFRKIEFSISKGGSGQIRIMYFVDFGIRVIKLMWIYSHEQFAKRPTDQDISNLLKEILDSNTNDA